MEDIRCSFCSGKNTADEMFKLVISFRSLGKMLKISTLIVMQQASDALSKTADSDTVSTCHVSSVQLVTDKKLEAFNKA